jgi:hypothetical protein
MRVVKIYHCGDVAEIVDADKTHIKPLADAMRDADRKECIALGYRAFRAINLSMKGSLYARTALVNGNVAAMYGVTGTLMSTGNPWVLTTDLVKTAPHVFLRETIKQVDEMLDYYVTLRAFIHNDYEAAIKFFNYVGFEISDEPVRQGAKGALWRVATMTKGG